MRSFRLALRVAPIVLVLLCAPVHLMRIRIARLASLFGPAVEVMEPLTNPPNWMVATSASRQSAFPAEAQPQRCGFRGAAAARWETPAGTRLLPQARVN